MQKTAYLLRALMLSLLLFPLAVSWSSPIVNGEVEDEFESAVALGAVFNGQAWSACSGNVITPRLILTAAHCAADVPIELLVEMGVAFFGTEVSNYDQIVGFEDFVTHPDYRPLGTNGNSDYGRFDLSLLLLSEDAPARPTWIRQDKWSEEEIGVDLVSVGFGIDDAERETGSGTRRSAELVLYDYDRMFLFSRNSGNPDNANICSGDSGGPQFHWENEQWVQVAVHSWGNNGCDMLSGSTRTDKGFDWIMDQVEVFHGTRDLCEAAGFYEDGTCDPQCDEPDPDCFEDTGVEEESSLSGCGCHSTGPRRLPGPAALLLLVGLLRRRP